MRLPITLLLVALGVTSADGGTIWLRDGRAIEADTWWEDGGTLYYEQFGGEIGIPTQDIDRIEGKSKPRQFGSGTLLGKQLAPKSPPSPPPVAAPPPAPAPPSSSVQVDGPPPSEDVVPAPQEPSAAEMVASGQARRRRAMAVMEEWARRKQNCRREYSTADAVRRCQNHADTMYREANERYIRNED
jgi:hypothetical protein